MCSVLGRQGLSDGGAVLCACFGLHLLLSVLRSYGFCDTEKGRHGYCFVGACVGGLFNHTMVMLTKNTIDKRFELALPWLLKGLLRHERNIYVSRVI